MVPQSGHIGGILLGLLVSASSGLSIPSSGVHHPSSATCVDYTIPLSINSLNFAYNGTRFKDDVDVAEYLFQAGRIDSASTFNPVGSFKNETITYSIAGTFCTPKSPGAHSKTVLLMTHGLGYDRRYWSPTFKPESYSFVKHAVDKGYSTFFYDRLGTGDSQKISGFKNQGSIQVEIIRALGEQLWAGKYTAESGKPKSIVLVGHSFGSFMSQTIAATYPDLFSGLVMTGTGYGAPRTSSVLTLQAFSPRIASQLDSKLFGDLDTGYLAFGDIYAHIETFFKYPNFDIDAAQYAHTIANPFAITEFLSIGYLPNNATQFTGPTLVAAAQYDLAVCGGNCDLVLSQNDPRQFFPKVKALKTYIHPGAGHGTNFNHNATGFFGVITDFLTSNGF